MIFKAAKRSASIRFAGSARSKKRCFRLSGFTGLYSVSNFFQMADMWGSMVQLTIPTKAAEDQSFCITLSPRRACIVSQLASCTEANWPSIIFPSLNSRADVCAGSAKE
ncbi:MAG: hypothetical protein EBY81_05180 [Verrucomicrobia bacterium]|nr:hypothetical protein [Verrucomicrobiota bacterium]